MRLFKRRRNSDYCVMRLFRAAMEVDKEAGYQFMRAAIEKVTGVRVETGQPKRLITAKRLSEV